MVSRRHSVSGPIRGIVRAVVLAVAGSLAAARAEAQRDQCDAAELEVRAIEFRGNASVADGQLASVIALTASDVSRRIPALGSVFGVRRCGSPALVAIDRARLVLYYRRRGFPDAAVDTAVTREGRTMSVRFAIREGRPIRVDTLTVAGLDGVRDGVALARDLPLRRGDPFDQYLLEASRDTLRRRLADAGRPFAQLFLATDTWGTGDARVAAVRWTVDPGPHVTLGAVRVRVTPREGRGQQVPSEVVASLTGLRPGQRFSQAALERATRALYQTDAFQQVRIEPIVAQRAITGRRDSAATAEEKAAIERAEQSAVALALRQDSITLDVAVDVAERFVKSRTVSAGFGTLDCVRAQAEYVNRNFMRRARRLELQGRISKVGVGAPLDIDGAGNLCPEVTPDRDPYSDRLNYYVGATLRPPVGAGGFRLPDVTLYSERRSEFRAYRRSTPIGAVASVTVEPFRRVPTTLAYDLSFGRTEAQPALFCSVLNRCTPEDRAIFETTRRIGILGANLTRDRTDNPFNPRRGSFARLSLRHASPATASDTAFRFSTAVIDGARYWTLGSAMTLALRVQLGAVFGTRESLVPPQERLYAGGPTTVRGFRQNELGPVAYVMNQEPRRVPLTDTTFTLEVAPGDQPLRIVPVGGNTVAVGNAELRVRSPVLPNVLQFTFFADAGQVWSRGASDASLRDATLKVTPGIGVRFFSPIGVIRLDFGYNDFAPRAGAAYFNDAIRADGTAPLLCVSPGNGIVARQVTSGDRTVVVQDPYASCPGSYAPRPQFGLLGPVTFFFAIGQAF